MKWLAFNKTYYLPSDSRSRTEWHSFLIKFFKKIQIVVTSSKPSCNVRTLPVPVEPDDATLIENVMAAAADVGAGNDKTRAVLIA